MNERKMSRFQKVNLHIANAQAELQKAHAVANSFFTDEESNAMGITSNNHHEVVEHDYYKTIEETKEWLQAFLVLSDGSYRIYENFITFGEKED